MAILINGNGNQAIYAAQDADWYASIFGGQTAITGVGYQFVASLLDANTIGVKDGVIITQEGRRIQLDANVIDTFDIPTGGQGETNYYIIGYHLVTGTQSEQTCETFVRLMENATDTIPEGTFRGGDDDVYISLYRVTQDDLVITDIDLLLPTVQTITELNNSLTDLREEIPKMANPKLDFAHPLHTFSSGNLSFTTTKECYICGSLGVESTTARLTIDGVNIARNCSTMTSYSYGSTIFINPLCVKSGSVISVNVASPELHVFDVLS